MKELAVVKIVARHNPIRLKSEEVIQGMRRSNGVLIWVVAGSSGAGK